MTFRGLPPRNVIPSARTVIPSVARDLLELLASATAVASSAAVLAGCAGGGPLLHPAKTLDKGEVRAVAGLSGNAVTGALGDGLRAALDDAIAHPGSTSDPTFARGALVSAVAAPGVAPFLAARVGIGEQFEAGLGYTGRSMRLDVRRAFLFGPNHAWAFSAGVGGTVALYGRQQGSPLPGVDLSELRGWGADVPLLIGYESSDGLFMFWAGPRGGWEHDTIEDVVTEPVPGTPGPSLTADRYFMGGVVGASAGFRHVHVALELDAQYESITGNYLGIDASVTGVAIVPAGAVWWDF